MNEDYKELVERVRGLDPEAAEYMETEAPKLERFYPSGALAGCFVWDHTPQGQEYWEALALRLEGEEE